MATQAEQTFLRTIMQAEAVRQQSKASAFTTWGYAPANQAAYIAAVATADNVYFTSINAAMLTLGTATLVGHTGPYGGNIASVIS